MRARVRPKRSSPANFLLDVSNFLLLIFYYEKTRAGRCGTPGSMLSAALPEAASADRRPTIERRLRAPQAASVRLE
jgi:hypothetical protein